MTHDREHADNSTPEVPESFRAILGHVGPGLVLAGSIVGSGELIMTTKLGAQAGFSLLWFLAVSCVTKVVVQAELARYTITSGQTFLAAFNGLPGPRWKTPRWLTLQWICISSVAVVGAVVLHEYEVANVVPLSGGVALASFTTAVGVRRTTDPVGAKAESEINWFVWLWLPMFPLLLLSGGAIIGAAGQTLSLAFPGLLGPHESVLWSTITAFVAGVLLIGGRYQTLEKASVALVFAFTFITALSVVFLQMTDHAIESSDLVAGLSLQLPSDFNSTIALTALAVFAGTGAGTSHMIAYTYWCAEKGYARKIGPNEPTADWQHRARSWIRVMYVDVFLTMIVYTIVTGGFYLLGAAVLNSQSLDPDGLETLSVLREVYTTTLGSWAGHVFVCGAFVVLFTSIVAGVGAAGHVLADGLSLIGVVEASNRTKQQQVARFAMAIALILQTAMYAAFENPPLMIVISGAMAVVLYPAVGAGTLYFRHKGIDPRVAPGTATTIWLWLCCISMIVVAPIAVVLAVALR